MTALLFLTAPIWIILLGGAVFLAAKGAAALAGDGRAAALGALLRQVPFRWHRWGPTLAVLALTLWGAVELTGSIVLALAAGLVVWWVALNSDEADDILRLAWRGAKRALYAVVSRIADYMDARRLKRAALAAERARMDAVLRPFAAAPPRPNVLRVLWEWRTPLTYILAALILWALFATVLSPVVRFGGWVWENTVGRFFGGESEDDLRARVDELERVTIPALRLENNIARVAIEAAEETHRSRARVARRVEAAENRIESAVNAQASLDELYRIYRSEFDGVWDHNPGPSLDDSGARRPAHLYETGGGRAELAPIGA